MPLIYVDSIAISVVVMVIVNYVIGCNHYSNSNCNCNRTTVIAKVIVFFLLYARTLQLCGNQGRSLI